MNKQRILELLNRIEEHLGDYIPNQIKKDFDEIYDIILKEPEEPHPEQEELEL